MRTLDDVLLDICSALMETEVSYVVVGGFAVSVWGDPRPTRDVDIILDLEQGSAALLAEALQKRSLSVNPEDLEHAIAHGEHVTIFDEQSVYHVDALPAQTEASRSTLANRKEMQFHKMSVYFASAEETIANKLRFGGQQDLRDAIGIMVRQAHRLDQALLEDRCKGLGVKDQLAQLRLQLDSEME